MSRSKDSEEVSFTGSVTYLILYNLVQSFGWTTLTVRVIIHYLDHGHNGLYEAGATLLNVFQTLALLEIVHPMLGLVKTNIVLTGFQVMSRIFLTWGITYSVKETQDNIGASMFMLAWGITEIIRYSYYTCAQVKAIPYVLQWCRYTFFIILYPVGVTGELLSIYTALPYLRSSGMYSIALPNRANIAFNYYYMCIVAMFLYIPIFPQLYGHMFAQRKKILGGKSKDD